MDKALFRDKPYVADDDALERAMNEKRDMCYRRYITSEISLAKMSRELNISLPSLKDYSREDDYVSGRARYRAAQRGEKYEDDPRLYQAKQVYVKAFASLDLDDLAELTGLRKVQLRVVAELEDWPGERAKFQDEIIADLRMEKIKEYAIAKSEYNRDMIEKQLESYQGYVDVSNVFLSLRQQEVFNLYRAGDLEGLAAYFNAFDSIQFKRMLEVGDKAMKAQSALLGLGAYVDHNAAVSLLVGEGYTVMPTTYAEELEEKAGVLGANEKLAKTMGMPVVDLVTHPVEYEVVATEAILPGEIV